MVIEINPLTPAISVKVISFFEISFVTRKIVSGTNGARNLFCPLYDQIPAPLHASHIRTFFFFFLFQSVNSRTTVKPVLSGTVFCTRTVLDAIFPLGDCLIQGWLNWTNIFCPHFLHQTQIISIIVPIPPNFPPFPLVADCGVLLEIVDARMS